MVNIIIAGAPGAGKGTQCAHIVKEFGVVHLSTGDVLREAVKNGTSLGLQARSHMNEGRLVPTELVNQIVADKLLNDETVREKGWLLDGFPRTAEQAQFLVDQGLVPDLLLYLDVPDQVLVERITGRRIDPETGDVYHVKFNPAPADIEGRLIQRKDDHPDKLRTRLQAFHDNIKAVTPYFADKLVTVDAMQSIDAVRAEVLEAVQASAPGKAAAASCCCSKDTVCKIVAGVLGLAAVVGAAVLITRRKKGANSAQ
ncbi:MAG: hypothetical protein MHM6MM_006989 [Cercozoa sp. M6MM]